MFRLSGVFDRRDETARLTFERKRNPRDDYAPINLIVLCGFSAGERQAPVAS